MSVTHLYQDFSTSAQGFDGVSQLDDVEIEDQKLDAFEKGYQAGWDDAVNAQIASNTRICSDLGKNLQETSFAYHEARTTLTKSLKPLFSEVLDTLLPEIAKQSLGPQLVSQLTDMVQLQLDQVIEITVAPDNINSVETLIDGQLEDPFVLIPDPNLGDGQVFLRIGTEERELDFDHILETVRAAFSSFFTSIDQDTSHD